MSFLWDLVQQSQLRDQEARTGSLETRIIALEDEPRRIQEVPHALVVRLEKQFREEINRNGRIG